MRSKLLILAAGVGVGVAAWWMLDGRGDLRASQRELRQLQAHLDELRDELRHRSVAARGSDAAASGDVASLARREARAEAQRTLDEQPGGDEAKPARPPPMTFEQSQAAVFAAFGQESEDPGWSADATRKLDAAIRGHLPKGGRLGSITCHATMCQVEVFHSDPMGAQTFVMDAFRSWPGALFIAKDREEQGEHVVTVVASREGHELPLAPR